MLSDRYTSRSIAALAKCCRIGAQAINLDQRSLEDEYWSEREWNTDMRTARVARMVLMSDRYWGWLAHPVLACQLVVRPHEIKLASDRYDDVITILPRATSSRS